MLVGSVILYFLVTISIGYYASRRVSTAGDFINAGRNLPPAFNAAALFALWFGSETVFGASAEFAEHGFVGVIEDPLGGVLCLLLVGLVFSRRMYRLNMYTIGDLFRKQFGERIEMFSSFLMILSFIGYAGAQMVALGLISQTLLGISLNQGIVMGFAIVLFYTYTGGMWAVSITDFLQSILIVSGLVAMAWYVTDMVGGAHHIWNTLTPEQKQILPDNTATDWINWFSAWMVLGFGSIASQDIFQRVNAARSEEAAYSSSIVGAALYLIFSMLPLYLITAIRIIDPAVLQGDLQLALPQMVLNHMPVWLQILFFGSLMSAIMSTCSGALLAPASLLSENIIKPMIKGSVSDKKLLTLSRVSVVIVGCVSLTIAFGNQSIFDLVGEASVFGLVSIFVPFVAALFYDFQHKIGALSSMILGSCVWVYFSFFQEIEINPLVPGFFASILGLILGYYLPRHMPSLARLMCICRVRI
jgi:solute:Na+ symporter, SSS family